MTTKSTEYHIRDLIIDDEYGTLESSANIVDAAKKMKELNVPDLVILDPTSKKVIGIIADFDIVSQIIAESKDPAKTKATEAMYTITPVTLDTPVSEAFKRMQDLHVNVVPVVDKDKLLGVATIQDCWGYIPDINVDEIGLIPVADPRNAEFWFATISSVLAFVLGILLPLIGIFGYFTADVPNIRGSGLTYFLFEAHGNDAFLSYTELNSGIWILILICSILVLITGLLGMFALIYVSYSTSRKIKSAPIMQTIIPVLPIIFMMLEWVLLRIALIDAVTLKVEVLGLVFSIASILLFLAALFRDYLFVQKPTSIKSTEGSVN